ncbi:serine/threonine-protein kinase [Nonomuraea fuscirosea]|uniref:serine/threonine-protein kinase n=1 Tax=Nonomuraea fuscirosea TaxID=1291556 RepID=UPI00340EEABF
MSPVGRGGMGMVWHAHDVLLDRDVAVKELILPYGLDHAGKQVAHRRMLREARSAARLTHPGIVTVHDVVEEDGRPWIVMELVRAWSLEQAVRQSGPLPVIQAAEIGIRVLDAVRHAHAAGILHRDIKPGNVLLTSDRVVLTDFGIAAIEGDVTITQTGLLMGSPAYIPPERLSGQPITQAADLWSFGATLYAAVEGRPPYEGPDPVAVLGSVLTQDPITPQRAGSLLPVIEGLLLKDPARRLTSTQVIEMLEAVLRAHGAPRPRTPEALPSQSDPTPAGLLPPLDTPSGPMPSRIVETPSGPVRVPYDPQGNPSGGYSMPPYDGLTSPSAGHRTDQLPQLPRMPGAPSGPRPGTYDSLASSSGPYDSLASGSGGYDSRGGSSGPYDSLASSSGPYDSLASGSGPYDSLASGSGPYNSRPGSSGPYDSLASSSGPYDSLASSSGPAAMPFGAPPGPRTGRHPDDDLDSPAWPRPQPILPLTTDSRASAATPWPLASPDDLREQSRGLSRDIGRDRLTTLPSATPRAGKSRRRSEEDDGPWVRDGRPTPLTIISSLLALTVVTGAVLIILTGGSPGTPPTAATAVATGAATSGVSPLKADDGPSSAPEGYTMHTGAGFAAAAPASWKPGDDGDRSTFSGPKDSGMRIVVERATPQSDGGLTALGRQEADGGLESYIQVQLQSVDYRDWQAADWEYTYTTPNGVPMHALTRYVSIDKKAAFKITFDLPELKWDDQAGTREVFLNTFRQA